MGMGMILQVGAPIYCEARLPTSGPTGQVAAFPRRDNDQLKRSTLEVVT